jgi:hypothetical protein
MLNTGMLALTAAGVNREVLGGRRDRVGPTRRPG